MAASQEPAPIPVPVSNDFLGDDGQWSAMVVRVGSNSQYLSLLPNTASSETWVIGPGGCDGTSTCQDDRGGVFFARQSTTWADLGDYELDVDLDLGDTGYADYGLDTIALSDSVSLDDQVLGMINTTEYWLGQFGLGVHSTRFSGDTNHLALLSSLVENASLIPSHSYGYTAGAYYRLKNVPASLTLGGVDTNRFEPNSATFSLGPELQPIVAVNEISVRADPSPTSNSPKWSSNPLTLLDANSASLFTIDSSTPFLWLPQSACDEFAAALGLTYNETLDLYLFNTSFSSPATLKDWNMTFTISISDFPGSTSNRVDLTFPYTAFDLQLTFPFPNLDADFNSPPTNYFPLRPAVTSDQYTLGRAFLQETYLTVDYERNNFSLSQAKFALDALTNINLEPITRPPNSNWTGPVEPSSSGLGTGAKVGAAIAVVVIVSVVAALCYYLFFIRTQQPKKSHMNKSDDLNGQFKSEEASLSELPGDQNHRQRPFMELPASRRFPLEAEGDCTRWELPGSSSSLPVEMPAAEVPATFLSSSQPAQSQRGGHRYLIPDSVQHARSPSTQKAPLDVEPSFALQAPTSPRLPPYSPSSNGLISPNSSHPSNGEGLVLHTTTSSDRQVSPMECLAPVHSRAASREEDNSKSNSSVSPLDTARTSTWTGNNIAASLRQLQYQRPVASGHPSERTVEDLQVNNAGQQNSVQQQLERPARFSWEYGSVDS